MGLERKRVLSPAFLVDEMFVVIAVVAVVVIVEVVVDAVAVVVVDLMKCVDGRSIHVV